MTALLELVDVRSHGSRHAPEGCSFAVAPGEVVALLGRNGAGKTVTLKAAAGFAPLYSGRVLFAERDISTLSPERRAAMGLAFVAQERRVFGGLTAEQNLRLGAYRLRGRGRARYDAVRTGVLVRFPLLAERLGQDADALPGGHQTMLAIARALMSEPKLLLLDEPFGRLSERAAADLAALMRDLKGSRITIVLAEQNVDLAASVADRLLVIDEGRVVPRTVVPPR